MALLREVIQLPHARVEVEQQEGLLFIVETGQIKSLPEVARYIAAMDDIVRRTGTDRAVIDARGEIGDPPAAVREVMWSWILDPGRGFSILAFVLPTEMAIARVNMTALSQGAKVRAFDSVFAAQRWIARGPRFSTAAFRPPSSRPPPMEQPPARPRRATAPGAGFYSAAAAPVDRVSSGTRPAPPEPGRSGPGRSGLGHSDQGRSEQGRSDRGSSGPGRSDPESASRAPSARDSELRNKRPMGSRGGGESSGGGSRVA